MPGPAAFRCVNDCYAGSLEPSQLGFSPRRVRCTTSELAKQQLAEGDGQRLGSGRGPPSIKSEAIRNTCGCSETSACALGTTGRLLASVRQLLAAFDRGYRSRVINDERVLRATRSAEHQPGGSATRWRSTSASWTPLTARTRFRLAVAAGTRWRLRACDPTARSRSSSEARRRRGSPPSSWAHALKRERPPCTQLLQPGLWPSTPLTCSASSSSANYFMVGDRRRAREYFARVINEDKQGYYSDRVRELTNPTA